MLDLTGKVAFVTGAGSVGEGWGNGKATAVLMARQGAKVFGVDINAEALAGTSARMEQEGHDRLGRSGLQHDRERRRRRPPSTTASPGSDASTFS